MKRTLIAAVLALGIHAVLLGAECSWLKQTPARRPKPRVMTMTLTVRQSRSPVRQAAVKIPDDPPKTKVHSKTLKKKQKTLLSAPKSVQSRKASLQPPKKDPRSADVEKTVESFQPPEGPKPVVPEADSKPMDQSKKNTSAVQFVRDARPLYRTNPAPDYPRMARHRGYQGNVVLEVLVARDGSVGDLRVFKSSGYSVLDQAALDSVKKWAFVPGMRGNENVEMWVRVPIRFELK